MVGKAQAGASGWATPPHPPFPSSSFSSSLILLLVSFPSYPQKNLLKLCPPGPHFWGPHIWECGHMFERHRVLGK